MPGTIDEADGSVAFNFILQGAEFAIEQEDVPHHQIAGIGLYVFFETESILQVF